MKMIKQHVCYYFLHEVLAFSNYINKKYDCTLFTEDWNKASYTLIFILKMRNREISMQGKIKEHE